MTEPLRVLYLIDSLGPGGAQRQLVTLVRALDRSLVEPEVAVYHDMDHFRPELVSAGVPVHLLRGLSGRDPRVLLSLARLIAVGGYDIVHSFLRTPGTLARLASPFSRGARTIVSERSVDLGSSPVRLAMERLLCSRADVLIANSAAFAKEIVRLVPGWSGRVRVVPNGIDLPPPTDAEWRSGREFRERHAAGAKCLLGVVGRIAHEKGPDLLADALGRLPEQVVGRLRVVWVGSRVDAELAASVESQLRSAGLSDRVVFAGETRDTRSVYLGVDGVVLCSRREGLPNVVLEALAHGRPVIATDVGDTSELLAGGDTGWLVPVGDPDALAGAILEFVSTSPDDLANMGAKGTQLVRENYSTSRLVERTMSVYAEVMERGSGDSGAE